MKNIKILQTVNKRQLEDIEDSSVLEAKGGGKAPPKLKISNPKILKKLNIPSVKVLRKQPLSITTRRKFNILKHINSEGGSGPVQPPPLKPLDSKPIELDAIEEGKNVSSAYLPQSKPIEPKGKIWSTKVILDQEKEYEKIQNKVYEKISKISNEFSEIDKKMKDVSVEEFDIKLAKLKSLLISLEYKTLEKIYQEVKYKFNRISNDLIATITEIAEAQQEYEKASQKLNETRKKVQLDQIEKFEGMLKLTITTNTWATIVNLFKENSTIDFLSKLKNKFSFFIE